MKNLMNLLFVGMLVLTSCNPAEKRTDAVASLATENHRRLFLDVHNLEPGKVTFAAVADAHQKDLATQGQFDVNFIKYWVDEQQGKVYCLVEAPDSASVYQTHKEAHGLVPDLVGLVTDGPEVSINNRDGLYLDVHELGAGKVTAADVAGAHEKDLAVQGKYDVSFINYWVDEKAGTVVCLSEAVSEDAIINTHKEAHGLIPQHVHKVKQGE
jgi:hypothetical protein